MTPHSHSTQLIGQDKSNIAYSNNPPRWIPESVSVELLIQQIDKGILNINPPHQRDVVHDNNWKADIISSVFQTGCIPETFWHPSPGQLYHWDSVDGKQRCSAFVDYYHNRFKWDGMFFQELPQMMKCRILNFHLTITKADRTLTATQLRDTFVRFQVTKQTKLGEVWNADTCELLQKLRQFVKNDQDTLHEKSLFMRHRPERYQLLELYGTLFAYFITKKLGLTRKRVEKIWTEYRDLDGVTDDHWLRFRQLLDDMWSIIESSPKVTGGGGHVSTRVRPLFGVLIHMRTDTRVYIIEHLGAHLGEYEQLYHKIGGDHNAHHIRMVSLLKSVKSSLTKRATPIHRLFVAPYD